VRADHSALIPTVKYCLVFTFQVPVNVHKMIDLRLYGTSMLVVTRFINSDSRRAGFKI